jgi:hypothetical protein
MNLSKYILFTGAGFTKNFGGLLAKEMWSKIFNNTDIQSHSRLRELLLNDFDYESIYDRVINNDFTGEEKKSINDAIFDAYHTIDRIVAGWTFQQGATNPVNIYGVNKFIERFSGQRADTAGYFFTLNQDLFIERHFNSITEALDLPCMGKRFSKLLIEKKDFVKVPTEDELTKIKNNRLSSRTLYYVKLHGSYGWVNPNNTDNFVIGKEKDARLALEPLLSYYFDLFKEMLSIQECKLFVIGYSFRDKHINKVIADSVSKNGLKLYVISPKEQSSYINDLKNMEHGQTILKALGGYFPYTLLDIFPQDQSKTYAWKEIVKSYFSD